ncbi:hypothetical protein E2C01_090504 [Portunus trituberculatus]|uniref:Uncharacterized protein n=1 Tax=Portunus trituberculatus TaxID=210409 RepID=A0A5B7JEV7_PORTR|nr:hypothetical protein [Portunus trituberculatus]
MAEDKGRRGDRKQEETGGKELAKELKEQGTRQERTRQDRTRQGRTEQERAGEGGAGQERIAT